MGSKTSNSKLSLGIILSFLFLINTSLDAGKKRADKEEEIKINEDRIIGLVSSLMPEYPQAAFEADIGAEVWTRFKIDSQNYVHSVEVISCSVDSFGFEEAALEWMRKGEFHFRKDEKVKPNDLWFSRLTFMPEKWSWQLQRKGDSTISRYWPQAPEAGLSDTGTIIEQTMPELTSRGKPKYPSKARYFGQSCEVTVRVLVSQEGLPLKVLIQSTGDPEWRLGFNESAIVGAKECRFKPATQNGKPVKVWVSFPFEFHLTR